MSSFCFSGFLAFLNSFSNSFLNLLLSKIRTFQSYIFDFLELLTELGLFKFLHDLTKSITFLNFLFVFGEIKSLLFTCSINSLFSLTNNWLLKILSSVYLYFNKNCYLNSLSFFYLSTNNRILRWSCNFFSDLLRGSLYGWYLLIIILGLFFIKSFNCYLFKISFLVSCFSVFAYSIDFKMLYF